MKMKIQCVNCYHVWEGDITEESVFDRCPNCGKVDDLLCHRINPYNEKEYSVGVFRSGREEDFWERLREAFRVYTKR